MNFTAKIHGFTLIELLVTLAIMGVLATVTIPLAEVASQRSKEKELRHVLREIRNGIDAYKRAYDEGKISNSTNLSGYPNTLNSLVDGVTNQRDPLHHKLYFLRKIPRDPMHDNAEIPDDQTWGKRSYASDADNPQEGEDVFDVYSQSDKSGLNNVPYKKW